VVFSVPDSYFKKGYFKKGTKSPSKENQSRK